MNDEEMKTFNLGVDVLENISARLRDFQVRFNMLFHMTEKHQEEVRNLLRGMQR